MIYFIQNLTSKAIKIGVSVDPDRRIKSLCVASADPLRLLGSIPGSYELERELHRRFAAYRVRGEWFSGDPPVIEAIGAIIAGEPAKAFSRSVWDECLRRGKCRIGLKGLEVRINGDDREQLIHHSLWDEHGRLVLVLEDGDRVLARSCTLLEKWPVTCCRPGRRKPSVARDCEELNPGTRVILKVPTMFGNKGPGTVVDDFGSGLRIQLDCNEPGCITDCCRHEVSVTGRASI